ncbi:tryptophan 7-halogenase [Marinimicrobium sp. C6131]|uniref:tryptophan halogenase family protein n=1 Tax=Marinimicrobium sp. C6131 TaxID=3022676 RepID=UPI00223CD549|nr:tryptophan halogenase family protein [Marinimicrobium sp. C6131]UZJ44703.1 tryptophan 7-halogenase [Marinimicrobium sp. C6131]
MKSHGIKSLVVVGGGSAGWMAASYFAKKFMGTDLEISLVESSEIGSVGVGEATVPAIKYFLSELDIDEKEFVRSTNATFKLGIDFKGWCNQKSRFFHPFAKFGCRIGSVDFINYWTKARLSGCLEPIDAYSLPAQIARYGRFAIPKANAESDGMLNFNYAYHFDSSLFAAYLKSISVKMGVKSIDGTIKTIEKYESNGAVKSLILEDGSEIFGDFYIDCSGFSGLLINSLDSEYEDWSDLLPCDSACVAQTKTCDDLGAYTTSTAMSSGWRWSIPLQNRVGNGYVYSSKFIDDERAKNEFLDSLGEDPITGPKVIKFRPGQKKRVWVGNVFSVGLSSGFLEPLESTSLYLVQYSLLVLFNNFPSDVRNDYLSRKVNDQVYRQVYNMRDFLVAHYCNNDRNGEPFWDYCRKNRLPESLLSRIEEFREGGSIDVGKDDFFKENSWVAILTGMGVVPEYFHPKLSFLGGEAVRAELRSMKEAIDEIVPKLPTHNEFLKNNVIF